MSRRARERRAATNAWQIAINGAQALSAADVRGQRLLLERAVSDLSCGLHCGAAWATLADAANMAETLCGMRLGSGPDAERVIEGAQQALADVHGRHAVRGTWTLWADEIDALQWLVRLYVTQIEACSFSEFERAYQRTRNRIAQAVAGNAAPGTRIVVGRLVHQQPAP